MAFIVSPGVPWGLSYTAAQSKLGKHGRDGAEKREKVGKSY